MATSHHEMTRRLAHISERARQLFKDIHSAGSVFRSLVKGIDFTAHAAVIEVLENELTVLGGEILSDSRLSGIEWRVERIHWGLILAAVSALAELNEELRREFAGGPRSEVKPRYRIISCYTGAMSEARKLEKQLLASGQTTASTS